MWNNIKVIGKAQWDALKHPQGDASHE
jgi:cytochrome c oxidase subunit 2